MDIISVIQNINLVLIAKVFYLLLLGVYIIFVIMLNNKIRSFDKIITLSGKVGSGFVRSFAYFYLFVLLFLFVLALVIV